MVVGASMAGLCAARVLADRFDRVTVLDCDTLPEGASPRGQVPQGRQPHLLLGSGAGSSRRGSRASTTIAQVKRLISDEDAVPAGSCHRRDQAQLGILSGLADAGRSSRRRPY